MVDSAQTGMLVDKRLELWRNYFSLKTNESRNQLVEEYMFLVNKITSYYYAKRIGNNADYADYQHSAVIGLIQAVESYKDNYGAKFETYASFRIKGNILNSIKNMSEKNNYIAATKKRKQELYQSVDMSAGTPSELSLFERIVEATLELSYSELMDKAYQFDDEYKNNYIVSDGYQKCELEDIKRLLHEIVKLLPESEQMVIRYYYYYELSFSQISELLDLTNGRISQIHKKAMKLIREIYAESVDLNK